MMGRFALLTLLAAGTPLLAQAPRQDALARAAASITESDVARRIGIIAHDSMGGRDTPSRGLDLTAQYIADEFRRFGLKPGGDNGTYLQRFPIRTLRVVAERSTLRVTQRTGDGAVRLGFGEDAVYLAGGSGSLQGGVVLLGGKVVPDSVPVEAVRGRIVIWVADWSAGPPAGFDRLLRRLSTRGVAGIVAVVNSDSLFDLLRRQPPRERLVYGLPERWVAAAVRERAVVRQAPDAAAQFAELRAAPAMVIQPMLEWEGELAVQDTVLRAASAPNTVGILEGSDPVLRNEYLVYSAHMDHVGFRRTPAEMPDSIRARTDTIWNGADDDASGTIGVVELAEAFSRPGARPRRSVIFLTVSGEEKGLNGSEWFAEHPPAPINRIVANLNIDMIGRNWKDTIVAIGRQHSDLGATLARVNAQHPELGMTAIDDLWPEENFYGRSDHYNFARKGVPILFFFNGTHADYHGPADHPDKIDAEKEARIVRLLFYLGQAIANADAKPRWVPESYQRIVTPDS